MRFLTREDWRFWRRRKRSNGRRNWWGRTREKSHRSREKSCWREKEKGSWRCVQCGFNQSMPISRVVNICTIREREIALVVPLCDTPSLPPFRETTVIDDSWMKLQWRRCTNTCLERRGRRNRTRRTIIRCISQDMSMSSLTRWLSMRRCLYNLLKY